MNRSKLEKETLKACPALLYHDLRNDMEDITDRQLELLYKEFKRHTSFEFCCITVEDQEEVEAYKDHEPEFGLAYEDFITDIASELESTAKFYSFASKEDIEEFLSTYEGYYIEGSL